MRLAPSLASRHRAALFNPNTDDLFAGITGVELQLTGFELGDGIVLTRAFGHVMFAPHAQRTSCSITSVETIA